MAQAVSATAGILSVEATQQRMPSTRSPPVVATGKAVGSLTVPGRPGEGSVLATDRAGRTSTGTTTLSPSRDVRRPGGTRPVRGPARGARRQRRTGRRRHHGDPCPGPAGISRPGPSPRCPPPPATSRGPVRTRTTRMTRPGREAFSPTACREVPTERCEAHGRRGFRRGQQLFRGSAEPAIRAQVSGPQQPTPCPGWWLSLVQAIAGG